MEILKFIKEYWVQLIFFFSFLGTLITFIIVMIKGIKCSLRNDILTIFDRCKDKKQITHYQLEALEHSADLYFKLKGNSFVKSVVNKVRNFEIID